MGMDEYWDKSWHRELEDQAFADGKERGIFDGRAMGRREAINDCIELLKRHASEEAGFIALAMKYAAMYLDTYIDREV